jgi:hypothetical protein
MTYREIAEVLRVSKGAYFCPNSPAILALESMIDTMGIGAVLIALAYVCGEKAEHLAVNWQDTSSAKDWTKRANSLEKLADTSEMKGR